MASDNDPARREYPKVDTPPAPTKAEAAHVFEGEPDSRQSADVSEKVSRFRPRYRALSDDEKALHDDIKTAYESVEQLISQLPAKRYRALALTSLEESCMWAIKELTDNH